jgi:hypothetical protein
MILDSYLYDQHPVDLHYPAQVNPSPEPQLLPDVLLPLPLPLPKMAGREIFFRVWLLPQPGQGCASSAWEKLTNWSKSSPQSSQ